MDPDPGGAPGSPGSYLVFLKIETRKAAGDEPPFRFLLNHNLISHYLYSYFLIPLWFPAELGPLVAPPGNTTIIIERMNA